MNLKKTRRYQVFVDGENNAEKWLDCGGRELWEAFSGGKFRDEKEATVAEITAFFVKAEKIPGWSDGPDNAKYPFYVIDFEDLCC